MFRYVDYLIVNLITLFQVSATAKIQTSLVEPPDPSALKQDVRNNSRKPKLPLWANFSILLLFNTFGAFLYMAHGETKPVTLVFLRKTTVCGINLYFRHRISWKLSSSVST